MSVFKQYLHWSKLKALYDAIERKVDQVRCHGGEQTVTTGADAPKSIRERLNTQIFEEKTSTLMSWTTKRHTSDIALTSAISKTK